MSRLGTKIYPNELIFHGHIEEKNNKHILLIKKNQFNKVKSEKTEFQGFASTMSSILRPRISILDFLVFYLIKLISFMKQNMLVLFSVIYA